MLVLAITIWCLLGTCACGSQAETVEDGPVHPYAICSEHLIQGKNAFIVGGMSSLLDVVYTQYLKHPSGSFVLCYENVPRSKNDSVGDMVLSIHPFLPNLKLDNLVNDSEDMNAYFELKKMTLLDNINTNGNLYNFTEPFDEFRSTPSGTISLSRQLHSFVGFIYNAEMEYIHCACQYTGVPDGARYSSHNAMNNISNAARSSQQNLNLLHVALSTSAAAYFLT